MGMGGQGDDPDQPRKPKQQIVYDKQHNSDWNKVIEDSDRNLFFAVTEADSQRSCANSHQSNKMLQTRDRLKDRFQARRQLPQRTSAQPEESKEPLQNPYKAASKDVNMINTEEKD